MPDPTEDQDVQPDIKEAILQQLSQGVAAPAGAPGGEPTYPQLTQKLQQEGNLAGAGRLARNAEQFAARGSSMGPINLETTTPQEEAAANPATAVDLAAKQRQEETARASIRLQLWEYQQLQASPQYRQQKIRELAQDAAAHNAALQGRQATPEEEDAMFQQMAPSAPHNLVLSEMITEGQPRVKAAIENAKAQAEAQKAASDAEAARANAANTTALIPANVAAKKGEAALSTAQAQAKPGEVAAQQATAAAELAKAKNAAGTLPMVPPAIQSWGTDSGPAEIAPGYVQTGGMTPEEQSTWRGKYGAAQNTMGAIDRVLGETKGADFVANPEVRAKVQPELTKILLDAKKEAAARGMSPQMLDFLDKMVANPTELSVANVAGLSHVTTRLQTLKNMLQNEVDTANPSVQRAHTSKKYPGQLFLSDGTRVK